MVKTISNWTVKVGKTSSDIRASATYGESSVHDIIRALIECWNVNYREAIVWACDPSGEVIAALFPNGLLIGEGGVDRTQDYPYLYMIMREADAAAKEAACRLVEASRNKHFGDDIKAPFDWRVISY